MRREQLRWQTMEELSDRLDRERISSWDKGARGDSARKPYSANCFEQHRLTPSRRSLSGSGLWQAHRTASAATPDDHPVYSLAGRVRPSDWSRGPYARPQLFWAACSESFSEAGRAIMSAGRWAIVRCEAISALLTLRGPTPEKEQCPLRAESGCRIYAGKAFHVRAHSGRNIMTLYGLWA